MNLDMMHTLQEESRVGGGGYYLVDLYGTIQKFVFSSHLIQIAG